MRFLGAWFWSLWWKWKEWRYLKKYGRTMDEVMKDYGKNVLITERKDGNSL